MSLSLKISARPENLHVAAAGPYSLEEAKRTFLEVLAAVEKHKLGKVLFDGRDITGSPAAIERFFYVLRMRRRHPDRGRGRALRA